MRLITDISELQQRPLPPSVATIGFFDGVHRGHRFLIGQVMQAAREHSLNSLIVTFPQHPRAVMQACYQPSLLSAFDEKCSLLSATGVDACASIPFTRELALLSARDFMQHVLRNLMNVRMLVIGHDHRFGHNRTEGFNDYLRHAAGLGMEVIQAEAYKWEGRNISSSVVRNLLNEGKVSEAANCLGYNYMLTGQVTGGQQIGRTMGFPTANLQVDSPLKLIPADGAYAVYVRTGGSCYKGMLNIGCRPTIDNDSHRTIEVHLFDFNGNLYGHRLCIEFVHRIRGEQKFPSREALAARLKLDAEEAIRELKVKN